MIGRSQRSWEFCSVCENFFLLRSYSNYTRVSSALVWSTAFISEVAQVSLVFWKGLRQKLKQLTSLSSLSLRRDVGDLSLFYRYYSGKCSRELTTRVPPPLRRPRSTRGAMSAHQFCVD